MAWITAISLASLFWFLASNSNLESNGREDARRRESLIHCYVLLFWRGCCFLGFFNLFLIILCTMASVVRLFPLSTIRRIPLLLGSWTSIRQGPMKTSQITIMHLGGVLTAYGSDPSLPGYISVLPWQTRSTCGRRKTHFCMIHFWCWVFF